MSPVTIKLIEWLLLGTFCKPSVTVCETRNQQVIYYSELLIFINDNPMVSSHWPSLYRSHSYGILSLTTIVSFTLISRLYIVNINDEPISV